MNSSDIFTTYGGFTSNLPALVAASAIIWNSTSKAFDINDKKRWDGNLANEYSTYDVEILKLRKLTPWLCWSLMLFLLSCLVLDIAIKLHQSAQGWLKWLWFMDWLKILYIFFLAYYLMQACRTLERAKR